MVKLPASEKVGDLEVVASGTILGFAGRGIDVFLGEETDAADPPMRAEFRFITNDEWAETLELVLAKTRWME